MIIKSENNESSILIDNAHYRFAVAMFCLHSAVLTDSKGKVISATASSINRCDSSHNKDPGIERL